MKKGNITEKILKSAEYLFAANGFTKTTIAEIAGESKVAEASVYSNFKTKKNIVFAIYANYIQKANKSLVEHFKGIREPGPKLRKLIWHYLNDIKENPNYAKLLMMGLIRSSDFYDSRYSKYLNEYLSLITDVIVAGQEEGLLRRDVSRRLIRNLILGTCVFTVCENTALRHPFDPEEHADIVYQLVLNATGLEPSSTRVNSSKTNGNRSELRKAQILETATRVFAKNGFLGSKISDIAKEVSLADGTLYEYFSTKEEILFNSAETNLQDISMTDDPFFTHFHGAEKDLRKLIWSWIWLLWRDEDFARVLTIELFRNYEFYFTKAYKFYNTFLEKIRRVVEQGREEGIFIKDVPFPTYFYFITGTIDQYLLSDFILNRPQTKIAKMDKVVDTLIRAISQKGV